ncbi:MAG: hypothetical protein WBG43_09900 [Marinifilaceae bacterium]
MVNYLGLFSAFFLVLAAMYGSYLLIMSGHETLGGIFGGSTIIAVAVAFLKKVNNVKK